MIPHATNVVSGTTQRMRARRLQEEAERQSRYLAKILGVEIIGFTFIIIMELLR